jgi:hypothetical protein
MEGNDTNGERDRAETDGRGAETDGRGAETDGRSVATDDRQSEREAETE